MSETHAPVPTAAPQAPVDPEARTFSVSILVSATRCMLTYVVLPWLLPLVGLSDSVGPGITLPVGLLAVAANIWSIRRFWRADHRFKWAVTVISGGVLILLAVLITIDVRDLLS